MSGADCYFPHIPKGRRFRIPKIAGAGNALACVDYFHQKSTPILFIAKDILSAERLVQEISFFAPEIEVCLLPEWDVLPYDSYSPAKEVMSVRMRALSGLLDKQFQIIVASATAMLLPYAPCSYVAKSTFSLKEGNTIILSSFIARLVEGGYERVNRVLSVGEFTVNGGQIDFYPIGATTPFRIVLADDEIEQIRTFNPQTQRSIEQVRCIDSVPMSECDLSTEGITRFRNLFLEQFNDGNSEIYKTVSKGEVCSGVEFYLPLFHEKIGRLFDYLPEDTRIVLEQEAKSSIKNFLHQARLRQKLVSVYENRPALAVSTLFLKEEEFFTHLSRYSVLELSEDEKETCPPNVFINLKVEHPTAALKEFVEHFDGLLIVVAESKGRRDVLQTTLEANGLIPTLQETFHKCKHHDFCLVIATLRGGFIFSNKNIAVLTETELFSKPPPTLLRNQDGLGVNPFDVTDIDEGDLVIHKEYGVGRSKGLKNIAIGRETGDFLEIEYADAQTLWLPIHQLHLLDRYHGEASLSKMGGRHWKRRYQRVAKNVLDIAAQLLELQARRVGAKVLGKNPDLHQLAQFVETFIYEETKDQQRAYEEVLKDMCEAKPMDRLLVGDVGFGKTEIALRAAAIAVFSGYQVAVMAPTTLLANQLYQVFSNRFSDFHIQVGQLTRSEMGRQRAFLLEQVKEGRIDILVGTHALLQPSLQFQNLGLAIIDEEHRFGVRHKEQFKKMRANVDLLSLSATPIPRTLSMSLNGIRDLSLISTPPARLEIKTIVAPYSHAIVVEGCERELLRGGQVYFVHNEIRTIEEIGRILKTWLPHVKIEIAHGQMNNMQMEYTMRRFLRREIDILLCTTIVESGLDIANANTMIVNGAHRMGLSRLHQLRGRVGRGRMQGYTYFLIPEDGVMSKDAEARLSAAREYGTLGGGFFLAMRDLEHRGAGELLGEKQSGDIEIVGSVAYQNMIQSAVRQLQGEETQDAEKTTAISTQAAAMLPANYVFSPVERMRFYRRLNKCQDSESLDEIFLEWEDRFGRPPEAAQLLKELHRLRLQVGQMEVESIHIGENEATLTFFENPCCAEQLLQQITIGECQMVGNRAVKKRLTIQEPLLQMREVSQFFQRLSPSVKH